jgi:hypothetical protein
LLEATRILACKPAVRRRKQPIAEFSTLIAVSASIQSIYPCFSPFARLLRLAP